MLTLKTDNYSSENCNLQKIELIYHKNKKFLSEKFCVAIPKSTYN